jgi:hypothetical protein
MAKPFWRTLTRMTLKRIGATNLVVGLIFWAVVLGGGIWLLAAYSGPEWYDEISYDQALAHLNCQTEQCDRDLDVVLAGCVRSPPPTLPADHASAVYGCQYEWMEQKLHLLPAGTYAARLSSARH